MTKGLIKSSKQKQRLYENFLKNKTQSKEKTINIYLKKLNSNQNTTIIAI